MTMLVGLGSSVVVAVIVAIVSSGGGGHPTVLRRISGTDDCPRMDNLAIRKPILFDAEGASKCFGISTQVLRRVGYVSGGRMEYTLQAREVFGESRLFSPRHAQRSFASHIDFKYDDRLPEHVRPPPDPIEVNVSLQEILSSPETNRCLQASIPLDESDPLLREGAVVQLVQSLAAFLSKDRPKSCSAVDASARPVLWWSSPGSTSNAHYDRSLNLVVGINGSKHWDIWDSREVEEYDLAPWLSTRYQQLANASTLRAPIQVTVGPGEVLFVPPFFAHRVRTSDNPEVVFSLSLLAPSEEEDRWARSRLALQLFLGKWNREEKLVAVWTFLDILIQELTRFAPASVVQRYEAGRRTWPSDAQSFLGYLARHRYRHFSPIYDDEAAGEDLRKNECYRFNRLKNANALSHFRSISRTFSLDSWGKGSKEICGRGPLSGGVIWLSVANLVEELILFAVGGTGVDGVVFVFSHCFR